MQLRISKQPTFVQNTPTSMFSYGFNDEQILSRRIVPIVQGVSEIQLGSKAINYVSSSKVYFLFKNHAVNDFAEMTDMHHLPLN